MRRKHPESITDAVQAAIERVHQIDPRFDVKVELVDGKSHFNLQANEHVLIQWSCRSPSPDTVCKMADSIERGRQVEFSPGEVMFEGSPLFEQFGMTGGAFQTSRCFSATCTVACKSPDGASLASLVDIPGEFVGGRSEITFNGSWPKAAIKITFGPVKHNERIHMRLDFGICHWNGQPLCHLPYFAQIVDFIVGTANAANLTTTFSCDGNELVSLKKSIDTRLFPAQLIDDMMLMRKAREVAKRIGINPLWDTAALDDDDFRSSVNWLHGLLYEGGTCNANPSLQITMKCRGRHFLDDVKATLDTPRAFRISGTIGFDLLGERIYVSPLNWDSSACTLRIAEGVSE